MKSCSVCSRLKSGDTEREFNLRLFTGFIPFSEIHMDLKVMPESDKGHKYILIIVCAITRYCVCIKLKNRTAKGYLRMRNSN